MRMKYKQLNYNILYLYSYGTDANSTLLEDVDCSSSSYLVLLQCSYRSPYSTYCNDNNRDAVVVCCKYCTI